MSKDVMLFEANQNVLDELIQLIRQLDQSDYAEISPVLRSSSIGQHCRHIIELYQCLLESYVVGIVSYDKRRRDHLIETDKDFALEKIQEISNSINREDKDIILVHQIGEEELMLKSSYLREVLYNLEHCIHHQALIKLACQDLNYVKLSDNFGVARSTLAFKKLF
jgi:uncharacterized damage-inducible protein DinB